MGRPLEKALWVVRDRITSAKAIEDLLADAVERGIRDLVVQVRGRGDAYYRSSLEPRAETIADPDLDPLGKLVRDAAVVGVRIHAWGNVFFVWSHPQGSLPRDPRHVVNAHPEWLLRPPVLKMDEASADPRPDGRRPNPDPTLRYLDPVGGADWEGIYTDPAIPAVRAHTVSAFEEIVSRYPVAGFHHDYVRYPQERYATSPDDHAHVTKLVQETAARVRAARPNVVVSAAVFPDPEVARDKVLQRWPDWAARGWLDLVCPLAYRPETAEVARLLRAAHAAAPNTRMWGGLMGYADEPTLLRDQIGAAADAGCEGVILFAYDPARKELLDSLADA